MRVLKHGNRYEKCFECPICQCVFVATGSDAINDRVICPECSGSMDWKEGADYSSTGRPTYTPDPNYWSDRSTTADFEPNYTITVTNGSDATLM